MAAVKLRTRLDRRGNVPTFLHLRNGKCYGGNNLDRLNPEVGTLPVMDHGHLNFDLLACFDQVGACFVVAAPLHLESPRHCAHATH